MSAQNLIERANEAYAGIGTLIGLKPVIVAVSEGNPDPDKRRASVCLEFYGADSFEKAHQAHAALIAVIGE